ncbi:MAG: O-antigen ligase family protein [Pirellulales bacterium]
MTRFTKIHTTCLTLAMSALIVWTAWDRGGVYYHTQLVVAVVLLAFVILAACFSWVGGAEDASSDVHDASGESTRVKSRTMPLPFIVMISIVIWGFAFLQTTTMPTAFTQVVAPGVTAIYSDWISPEILAEATALESGSLPMGAESNGGVPLSVAPTYTRLAMLMPIVFAIVCWVLFHCFRNLHALIVFLVVISLSGVLLSFFGIVDAVRLAAHQQIELRQFLLITPAEAGDPFGPFVNNNNAAGFLCLCFACNLGLWVLCESLFKGDTTASESPSMRLKNVLYLTRVIALVMLVVLFAGILSSNSRGGFIGLVTGAVVVLSMFLGRANKFRVISVFTGLVVLVCLLVSLLGFGERVRLRLATLFQVDLLEDPRIGHWADALVAAEYYFPFGAGLGTYRYAHLPFQQQSGSYWFVHADGMPVEWLVEGGGWLMPLVVLLLSVLLRRTWVLGGCLRRLPISHSPVSDAVLRCVWVISLFAIPSLVATQFFDFGITLLPLLMTFAGISAAIMRASEFSQSRVMPQVGSVDGQDGRLKRNLAWFRYVSGGLFLAWSCCAIFMLLNDLRVASAVEEGAFAVQRDREAGLEQTTSLTILLAKLEQFSLQSPDNSMVWKELAEARLVQQELLGESDLKHLVGQKPELHQSWVARQNVRQVTHDKGNSLSFLQLLQPHQNAEQWGLARHEFLRALLLNPLDDDVRVSLVELDMVTSEALFASKALLTQAASLRPQHPPYINYLLWLAGAYPGEAATMEIQKLRLDLELED